MMRKKAVSQFISMSILIMLSIAAISLTLLIIQPALDKGKDSAVVTEAIQNLQLIDDNIREIASEGEGSRKTISLKVTDGMYRVDPGSNFLNFSYRTDATVGLSIAGKRGSVNVTSGEKQVELFIQYTNIDLQGATHFTKGNNRIVIINNGTDSSTNKPIIYIET
jgi:hypothetical protein